MTFMCLLLYGRRLSDKNIAENEAMICSAAWWKQWISPRFKSSFLVLFCFFYGVTYKPSRAGQNCYTWWCYSQWMYLQVTIIKIYLSIYLTHQGLVKYIPVIPLDRHGLKRWVVVCLRQIITWIVRHFRLCGCSHGMIWAMIWEVICNWLKTSLYIHAWIPLVG